MQSEWEWPLVIRRYADGAVTTDVGSVLPLVHLPGSDTTVIPYRRASDRLWAGPTTGGGPLSAPEPVTERAVVQSAVDSDQVGADAVAIDSTVHVLFIEAETGRLYHTRSEGGGAWSSPTLQVDSADVQWVRGRPVSTGSSDSGAYGYVYDAGSSGGPGRTGTARCR